MSQAVGRDADAALVVSLAGGQRQSIKTTTTMLTLSPFLLHVACCKSNLI